MAQPVPDVECAPCGLPPAPDPRVERTRRLALEAADRLFREGGWDAVTHLAVSERSGIGRSTLYRHWPDAAALLRELVVVAAGVGTSSPTGDLRTDLLDELEHFRVNLLDPARERAMLTVMERAAVDPSYAELRAGITRSCSRSVAELVRRAVRDGTLHARLDADTAIAELSGPLVFRRFFCRDDIPRAFLEAVVDDFLAAHLAG